MGIIVAIIFYYYDVLQQHWWSLHVFILRHASVNININSDNRSHQQDGGATNNGTGIAGWYLENVDDEDSAMSDMEKYFPHQ